MENFREWMPEHTPVWTGVGVRELGLETMRLEVEVEAWDEEGAAVARKGKETAT